jgi:hypothetical protein
VVVVRGRNVVVVRAVVVGAGRVVVVVDFGCARWLIMTDFDTLVSFGPDTRIVTSKVRSILVAGNFTEYT